MSLVYQIPNLITNQRLDDGSKIRENLLELTTDDTANKIRYKMITSPAGKKTHQI